MNRNKLNYGGRRTPRHNEKNRTARGVKKMMLDAGKENLFHFDINDILAGIGNKEAAGYLKGNITVKACMQGIDEAREYLKRMTSEGILTGEESHRITTLLMRYSTWR